MEILWYKIKRFLFNPWVFGLLTTAAMTNVFLWYYAVTHFSSGAQLLFVRYSVGVGVDFVGNPRILFLFPALATAVMVLFAILAFLLFEKARLSATVICGLACIVSWYTVIALLLAVSLNI